MNKLHITDERMLQLMNYVVNVVNNYGSEDEFMRAIDFAPTNISNVRQGRQRFKKDHIENACKITGASADYIFGFTNTMMRKESKDPIEMIKLAVSALESKANGKKALPKTLPHKK